MGLDAVDDDRAIRRQSMGVHVNRHGQLGRDALDLQAGNDGRAHGLLRYAIAGQNLALPLRGGVAMAAHRREDKGLGALGAHEIADRAGYFGDIGHPAAAHGDGDLLAGMNPISFGGQSLCSGFGDVIDMLGVKLLAYRHHIGVEHVHKPPYTCLLYTSRCV